jgi:parvulin-like peptidyl-prolyl isomerase
MAGQRRLCNPRLVLSSMHVFLSVVTAEPCNTGRNSNACRFPVTYRSFIREMGLPLLCLSILVAWPNCSPRSGSSQSVVVKVGDRVVTLGDLERIVTITSLENGISKKVVWSSIHSLADRIVDDFLILEYGEEMGITLPDIELERAIQDIVKDYPGNSFKETLLNRCIDYAEWKRRLREQLSIQKIMNEQASSLPPISHHAIKAYYEERKEGFQHPPRVKVIHIVIKEKEEAEALLARVKQEEDMTRLLQEQARDLALGEDHGEQWHTSDMLPPEVSEVAFSIEIDAISGVIETQYGFHIIKVLKRQPAGRKGLLEVITEIENRLLREAMERRYRVWLQELRKRYRIKVNHALLEQKKHAYAKD